MTENPNEYDDRRYTQASGRAHSAIGSLWNAGASLGEIEEIVRNALDDAGVATVVEICDHD